jgi:hypothetical protein
LQSGSPVFNSGRNGTTMGAYITGNETIGLISQAASDTTPPASPTGVQVQ